MATSAQLLKAQEAGAEIRITIAGQPEGGIVEYSPRHKGDRKAWAYTDNTGMVIRYAAKDVAAVTAPAVKEESVTEVKVTQEMIDALATLREVAAYSVDMRSAFRTLYVAGVFAAIDAADAKPEQASKCICPEGEVHHWNTCPEYPDNRLYYGAKNIAARAKEARREALQRAVGLKF